MASRCIATLFFTIAITLLTFAQGMPYRQGLPPEPEIEFPIASADSFPALQYHVKKLRCYNGNRKSYTAQYDKEGRIVRLEDFRYDSARPNVTTWRYAVGSTVKTTVVPPCHTCTKSTTITDRWKSEGEDFIHTYVSKTYFKEGKIIDSTYVRTRADGAIQDSVVFRNSSLVYSWKQTFHPNGKVRRFVVTDNSAGIDYLETTEAYEHDTSGNKVKYSLTKGGQLQVTDSFRYDANGHWTFFQRTDAQGNILQTQRMEYNADGLPLKRTKRDSTFGYIKEDGEEWRYDQQGRWVWYSAMHSSSYFYRRYLDESGTDYVELKRTRDVLRRTEVHTKGNIRTVTKSVHVTNAMYLPAPTIQLESDTLFRVESIEEFDTSMNVMTRKISFEHDLKKPNVKTWEDIYTYDNSGRLTKEVSWYTERDVEKVDVNGFEYNPDGQIISITRTLNNGEREMYCAKTYSPAGLLLKSDSCAGSSCVIDSFAYDSLNRMVLSIHTAFGETRTTYYSYACETIASKKEAFVGGFMEKTQLEYLPSCLLARYTITREWGVAQNMKWEYEFY